MRISDLLGTSSAFYKIGLGALAAAIKSVGGGLRVRNAADSADAPLTASVLRASGQSLELNVDAAGSGDDYKLTLSRPATGMSANYELFLPTGPGTAGYALVTDGLGGTSWASSASATNLEATDTTDLTFDSTGSVAMFQLPANAVVVRVQVLVDESFDGNPSLTIGPASTPAKYLGATQVELGAAAGTIYEVNPAHPAVGTAEDLIATYSAGGATEGSARLLVTFVIPS